LYLHRYYALPHVISTSFFSTPPPPSYTYTLSLHDALPISDRFAYRLAVNGSCAIAGPPLPYSEPQHAQISYVGLRPSSPQMGARSEEHTSELQSRVDLVCRLLLEKKKTSKPRTTTRHLDIT